MREMMFSIIIFRIKKKFISENNEKDKKIFSKYIFCRVQNFYQIYKR